MAILEEEVLINLTAPVAKYYEELEYTVPRFIDKRGISRIKLNSKILVKVNDLPVSSNIKVTKICDICSTELPNTIYFSIIKQRKSNNGVDYCKPCRNRLRSLIKAESSPFSESHPELSDEFDSCSELGYESYSASMFNTYSNLKVTWKCKKCKCKWTARISDRTMKNSGCPTCHGRVVSDKNRLSLKFPSLVGEWHTTKNGSLTPSDVTYSSHTYVWWKCERNHEWSTPVHSRTIMKTNCPICCESKGEKKIRYWLEKERVEFESQVSYSDLLGLGGKHLSYDFYIPSLNLLIEYQGEFHDGSGNNEFTSLNLGRQQEHDSRKKTYAKNNNINLLEIWYWEFDNIEKILKRIIN